MTNSGLVSYVWVGMQFGLNGSLDSGTNERMLIAGPLPGNNYKHAPWRECPKSIVRLKLLHSIRNYVMIDIPQYHFSSIILLQVNNIRFIIVIKV